mgnify:CR=1 FL=1
MGGNLLFMRIKNAHGTNVNMQGKTMQINLYNPEAKKKAANLSINSDLLGQAKKHRINLSKALEQKLAEMLLEKKRLKWKNDNREAIEAYNRRVGEHGVFSDGIRTF